MDVRSRMTYYKETPSVLEDGFVIRSQEIVTGFQRTESEGHPFSRIHAKTGEDIGGNFKTERWIPPSPSRIWNLHYGSQTWTGYVLPSLPDPVFRSKDIDSAYLESVSIAPSTIDLDSTGATAIADTVPTNPTFSAAAAIGELREGIPSLPGRTALKEGINPKSISGEYLNLQFGILPTISDVRKLVKAHQESSKRLNQLYRDSGKVVRRRRSFPPKRVEENFTFEGRYPWAPGAQNYTISTGTLTRQIITTRKYWFSGAYTYFFPKQEGWHRKIAELEKTYGVIPDISDVYQLTPWSWAVDWVSNTGDLVSNLNSFSQDNLVLRYGYIMCKTTREVHETWNGQLRIAGSWTPVQLTASYKTISKVRRKATPYGFGFNFSDFSPRQLAIISALGISRGGRR